ncbi:hypothetical protein SESBI_35141 [Sesbania bispinosa]|nr:hypothetical protein SESBI_35141 [Sesbania bispinosa]
MEATEELGKREEEPKGPSSGENEESVQTNRQQGQLGPTSDLPAEGDNKADSVCQSNLRTTTSPLAARKDLGSSGNKEVVILDSLSPTKERYQGATLSDEEIKKCRVACIPYTHSFGERRVLNNPLTVNPTYYVEFPSDEEQEIGEGDHQLKWQEEKQLIVSMNNSLSLKRSRPQ